MNKILQVLIKYIGYPLLEKAVKGIYEWSKNQLGAWSSRRSETKIKKKRSNLIIRIEKAKNNEERKQLSIELDRLNNG